MATKVLSVEIGQGLTRVVEMENKAKNPKVFHYFTFETPDDVIDDGLVKRNDTFAALMKAECEKRKIKTTQVVFSVNSSRIARRTVKIPLVNEKRIQDLIDGSATDFFPVDMTQYHLVYDVMEKVTKGENKGYRLNLLAVPNDLTASYFDFAQSLGWHLNAVDYAGNSVLQIVNGSYNKGVDILLKLDETSSLFTVLKDGKIQLQRNIAYGINDVVEAVRADAVFGENLTYSQAVEVLATQNCIRPYLNADEEAQENEILNYDLDNAKAAVTESLQRLINMINRVLEYYTSHNQDETIDGITLLGVGAEFDGIIQLFANELNHKVRVLQDAEVDLVNKTKTGTLQVSRYAACYGAVINPVNLIPEQGNKKKAKESQNNSAVVVGVLVLVAGILTAGVLAAIPYVKIYYTEQDIAKVEENIKKLEETGIEALYQEYVTIKQLADRMEAINNATFSRSEDLVLFIEELEEKMPSSLLVINFTATSHNVSMSIEVDSKEAAAETLMQLRTFDSVEVVSSTGLTDTLEEEESIVAFTVECVYKPVEIKEAE